MRYNAFYGELPLEAFKPIGGRMRLYGGGDPISAVSDAVSGAVSGLGDIGQGVINAVDKAGTQIDQTVRDVLPGGWTTAALLAGGYYYAPEIGAYVGTAGETVPLSEVVDAGVVSSPVTSGTVVANALPPLADVVAPTVGSATGTALANAAAPAIAPTVAPAVAPVVAPTTTALANLGATDASLGAAGAANAGTGGANFLSGMGAENAVSGAGVSGTGILSNVPAADTSFLSSLIPSTPMGQIAAAQGLTGLGSALIGSSAAQKAADIQSAAAQSATALQGQMFNQINQQQAPYRTAGYGALNKIAQLGGGSTAQYDANGNRIADLVSQPTYGGGGLTDMVNNQSQTSITPPSGWQKGSDYGSPSGMGTPYTDASGNAVGFLGPNGFVDRNGNPAGGSVTQTPVTPQQTAQSGQSPSDYLTHQFNASDLQAGLAPNYDFMLQQGQMANQRAANVGGGAIGGNALQGLNKYTQDYAGNAYQNAFQNYQQQRTGIYNTLAGIAGIGQTGQTSTNQAATNLANAQSQLGVGSAAAQAAGQIGTAGAYGNALGQLGSGLTLATLLNQRGNATLPLG